MPNGTDETTAVPWSGLPRANTHRTSPPTDKRVRALVGRIASVRSRKPNADAVFLAALELVDFDALMARVTEIERRQFTEAEIAPDRFAG